ncbi:cytochrome C biogenesis protein [Candidatus Woesearchaeota archaeon]|nr:cytochrome C biogenesis protein [Candidatus Woesearchaeota archaeon]
MTDNKTYKGIFIAIALFLFLIIFAGLFWLARVTGHPVGVALSFAAGLSMIFLPCTLPWVFVIVPMTMGKGYKKGFFMALLFGLGLTITITAYGLLISQLGKYLGLDRITRGMFVVAGLAAYIFGFSELDILHIILPTYRGSFPTWVTARGDYLKSFFFGLFSGNAGIGCPNPAFYVLLTYIATTGSAAIGAGLGFVHGLGRALPLIFFAILGIIGVNMLDLVRKGSATINRVTGWALIALGPLIMNYGLLGMMWWEEGPYHRAWNWLIAALTPPLAEMPGHEVATGLFEAPYFAGWLAFATMIFLALIPYAVKKNKEINTMPPRIREEERGRLHKRLVLATVLFITFVGIALLITPS